MAPPSDKRVDEAVRLLVTSSAPEAMKFTNGFSPEEIQNQSVHRNINKRAKRQFDHQHGEGSWSNRAPPAHWQSSQVAPAPARKVSRSASLKISNPSQTRVLHDKNGIRHRHLTLPIPKSRQLVMPKGKGFNLSRTQHPIS